MLIKKLSRVEKQKKRKNEISKLGKGVHHEQGF